MVAKDCLQFTSEDCDRVEAFPIFRHALEIGADIEFEIEGSGELKRKIHDANGRLFQSLWIPEKPSQTLQRDELMSVEEVNRSEEEILRAHHHIEVHVPCVIGDKADSQSFHSALQLSPYGFSEMQITCLPGFFQSSCV